MIFVVPPPPHPTCSAVTLAISLGSPLLVQLSELYFGMVFLHLRLLIQLFPWAHFKCWICYHIHTWYTTLKCPNMHLNKSTTLESTNPHNYTSTNRQPWNAQNSTLTNRIPQRSNLDLYDYGPRLGRQPWNATKMHLDKLTTLKCANLHVNKSTTLKSANPHDYTSTNRQHPRPNRYIELGCLVTYKTVRSWTPLKLMLLLHRSLLYPRCYIQFGLWS